MKRYKSRLSWKSNDVKMNVICILSIFTHIRLFMSVSCEWSLRVKFLPLGLFSVSFLLPSHKYHI